jgi:hypothetical protein
VVKKGFVRQPVFCVCMCLCVQACVCGCDANMPVTEACALARPHKCVFLERNTDGKKRTWREKNKPHFTPPLNPTPKPPEPPPPKPASVNRDWHSFSPLSLPALSFNDFPRGCYSPVRHRLHYASPQFRNFFPRDLFFFRISHGLC